MGRKARECVYPYGELGVGDSFVVDNCKLEKLCYLNRRFGKLLGRVFGCKTVENGIRVIRVK